MEEKAYIQVNITGNKDKISPDNIDISDIKEIISDIETFLYPSKKEKLDRPDISYKIEDGSVRHIFYLPISAMLLFHGLIEEIKLRNSIDFLGVKRGKIIEKFQEKAKNNNYKITFSDSKSTDMILEISEKTNYELTSPKYLESKFYLYGEIYQEGGKTPNLHIESKEYGNLTISASKEQLKEHQNKLYEVYGIIADGKYNLLEEKFEKLELIDFIKYKPKYDEALLEKMIKKASGNWSEIKNVEEWLHKLRGNVNA